MINAKEILQFLLKQTHVCSYEGFISALTEVIIARQRKAIVVGEGCSRSGSPFCPS